MRVSDYIIDYLGEIGVKEIFVFYGGAIATLIDGFRKTNKTKYITALHEQAGGFAAEAYAKVSGNLGVMIATSGPGGHNLVTPIGNCFYDSVPCLFLTGQVPSQFSGEGCAARQVGFQETRIADIVRPITKYSKMITDPKKIKYELQKAIFLAKSGRPGPVLLDLPADVQGAEINPDELESFNNSSHQTSGDLNIIDEKINKFIIDLKNSKRPTILIGGGVRIANALPEIEELQKILKLPFFPTWNAMDVITSDSEYYGGRVGVCGGKGRNFAIQNSDLLLIVGSRLSLRIPGGGFKYFARKAKKYMVEIDPGSFEAQKGKVKIDEEILCNAKTFLKKLIEKLKTESIPDFSEWNRKVFEWRDKYDPVSKEYFSENSNNGYVHPYSFMRILSQEMKPEDIIIADAGGNVTVFSQAFETKKGQRTFSSNGNSPMGFAFPAGIGAWLASNKNQNVVAIIGDGGFNLNMQELQTIKIHNIKSKTIILNNSCYGFTKQFQERKFQASEACGPEGYAPPDFIKIAEAYGVKTIKISTNNEQEIRTKIREMLDSEEAVICDVNTGGYHDYLPRVTGEYPIEDMWPHLPRQEFRENMIIEPVSGWDSPTPYS